MSTPPIIAEAARAAIEKVIEHGAVAVMIVYERPDGGIFSRVEPNMQCVRLGLLSPYGAAPVAAEPDEAGA